MASKGVLRLADNGALVVMFYCPGCQAGHGVSIAPSPNLHDSNLPVWGFNNNFDKPTFTPSIKVEWGNEKGRQVCHSFVTDGHIQFFAGAGSIQCGNYHGFLHNGHLT